MYNVYIRNKGGAICKKNKMFKNFIRRTIGIALICAICITSSALTDIKLADDSVEADDFDIPAEEGTYFFDGLSYKKIDKNNPFTQEMYNLAVSSLDGNGDYEVDEVIHNPDQCSIYNKDELDALLYVYNHDEKSKDSDKNDITKNINKGYLSSWSDDDWKFMRLVLQAHIYPNTFLADDNPAGNGMGLTHNGIFSNEGSIANPEGLLGNYHYVIRVIIPYDVCGNIAIDFVNFSIHTCERDEDNYLDELFSAEDKYFQKKDMSVTGNKGFPAGYIKFNVMDKTPHMLVDNNMVVITRVQQKKWSFTKNFGSVYSFAYAKNQKKARAGEIDDFTAYPLNFMPLFDKYINFKRYYSQERGKDRYQNPYFTLSRTIKKIPKGTATVYNAQEYFKKCDSYEKENPAVYFDWTPVTSSEMICACKENYVALDLYEGARYKNDVGFYPKVDKDTYNYNWQLIKRYKELAKKECPDTLTDNELYQLIEDVNESPRITSHCE